MSREGYLRGGSLCINPCVKPLQLLEERNSFVCNHVPLITAPRHLHAFAPCRSSKPLTLFKGMSEADAPQPADYHVANTEPAPSEPTVKTQPALANSLNSSQRSKEDKINDLQELRRNISTLIANVRNTKRLCEKYDSENQYLQDYVGSVMTRGDMKG